MGEITYTEYPFRTNPYKHQLDCWRLSKDLKSYGLLMDMGTGKSKVIIDTAGHLFMQGKIDAQVIVAPRGVYRNWVEDQIPTHMSDAFHSKVAYWSSQARKKEKEDLVNLSQDGNFLRTLAINVEALNSERAVESMLVPFLKKFRCLMTVDESTTIKNPSAKRTKICINIGRYANYRRICTGNPVPNGGVDLYSQAEFLEKNLLGFQNFYAFRNRFAVMETHPRSGGKSFNTIVGYRDMDLLERMMRKFAFVIKKEDCLDLPPKIYQYIDVEMGEQQTKAYEKMEMDSYIKLSQTEEVTAPMVITQLLRLHQIACGFITPDGGVPTDFDEPNDRMDQLLEILENAKGKAIVWATYRHNIEQIFRTIQKKFGEKSVVHFYGDTSPDARQAATQKFQDPNSGVNWMVSNPSTGKFGNTWTKGVTVVYYSNNYDLEARTQSEDRAHRIGQTEPVVYIDLRCRGTVDDKIIRVLRNKKKLTDEIVKSNWTWLIKGT